MKTTATRSLPLLAADPVALAIAEGRQTQHRVPMKPQPTYTEEAGWCWTGSRRRYVIGLGAAQLFAEDLEHFAPWQVGDSLYVREAWAPYQTLLDVPGKGRQITDGRFVFRADGHATIEDAREHLAMLCEVEPSAVIIPGDRWRPSIHMPEKAARTRTKPLTRVWAERVQDISEADARAEGCEPYLYGCYDFDYEPFRIEAARGNYRRMMEEFYPGIWERNDWLWCCAWDGVEVRT